MGQCKEHLHTICLKKQLATLTIGHPAKSLLYKLFIWTNGHWTMDKARPNATCMKVSKNTLPRWTADFSEFERSEMIHLEIVNPGLQKNPPARPPWGFWKTKFSAHGRPLKMLTGDLTLLKCTWELRELRINHCLIYILKNIRYLFSWSLTNIIGI